MNSADILSIVVNLAVGAYFAVIYPRSVNKRFNGQPLPRGFELLRRYIPAAGWLIIVSTLIYAVTLLIDG